MKHAGIDDSAVTADRDHQLSFLLRRAHRLVPFGLPIRFLGGRRTNRSDDAANHQGRATQIHRCLCEQSSPVAHRRQWLSDASCACGNRHLACELALCVVTCVRAPFKFSHLLTALLLPIQCPINFLCAQRQIEQPHTAGVRDGIGYRRRRRHVRILRDRFAAVRRRPGRALD